MSLNVEMVDGVALVTFQNAAHMNSFDANTLAEIRATFDRLRADDEVLAMVLTGEGKAFSTGADVMEFKRQADAGTATEFVLAATQELHPLMMDLHSCHKPFVAAVNGVAAGGGLGLALVADARVGSDQARFAAGYFGIGVSPDGGSTWILPRLIGEQRARRFFLDNQVMDANEALEAGLLDEIAQDPVARAVELAKTWAAWAKHSRASTKRLLQSASCNDFQTHLDLERGLIAAAAGTRDFHEGVTAFVERRKPAFGQP